MDKIIQELEADLRRLSPEGGKLDSSVLSQAVNALDDRVREQGLTASQIHFARDHHLGTNMNISDRKLGLAKDGKKETRNHSTTKSKAGGGKEHVKLNVRPGDIVYLRSDSGMDMARIPHLVTSVDGNRVTAQKLFSLQAYHDVPSRITSPKLQIDDKFLYIPPYRRQGTQVNRQQIASPGNRQNVAAAHRQETPD